VTVTHDKSIEEVAKLMTEKGVNHIPIVKNGTLDGIVTSWDVAKAVARGKRRLDDVAVKSVVTAKPAETLGIVSERLKKHEISALPVVDGRGSVLGIITAEDVSKFVQGS
ncbi:MAG: CBS domain-containing protein, partial [Candidatus Altiarchaeota archaeon]|nr:CBS domain-containing protein [Candidatus Altiarchaeota archaeon]